MEYKIGDEVLLRVKIVGTPESTHVGYAVEVGVFRPLINSKDIVALVERDGKTPDPIPTLAPDPTPKFSVGDKVIHLYRPDWGVGLVEEVFPHKGESNIEDYWGYRNFREGNSAVNYLVRFSRRDNVLGSPFWVAAERNLTAA